MSLFSKSRLLVGISTFALGVGIFAAVWGLPGFRTSTTTVKGQVTAYLLDDGGAVNGLLLASGDQLHFGPQTGEAVAAQIKVGDEVTATGRAGTKTDYGREVRVEQISANGRTITEAKSGPKRPHGPRDRRGPKDSESRAEPAQPEAKAEPNVAQVGEADPGRTENQQAAPPETSKATGTIRAHLVNGRGGVDGLVLSGGEQVRFSPKVGQLVIAAERGADTLVSVEGSAVRNERGTVLRPTLITVGDQTIALGR
jgi:hypothetical protein